VQIANKLQAAAVAVAVAVVVAVVVAADEVKGKMCRQRNIKRGRCQGMEIR